MHIIINIGAFAILSILWLGFAVGILFNQSILHTVWQTLRSLPFLIQALVWLLVLPVALGLWIWETSWPLWIRLILVAGLGWGTIYTFFPKPA